MADSAVDSAHAGKGAYRKDPRKYIGVIVNERRRREGVDGFVHEYGIRSPLGGLIFMPTSEIEIGEPEGEADEEAAAVGAPSRAEPAARLPGARAAIQRIAFSAGPTTAGGPVAAPTAVKVLGGFWIAIASLMLISAAGGLVAHCAMGNAVERGLSVGTDQASFLRFHKLLCALQLGAAILGFVASIRFLQGRAWARGALEFLTWAGLVVLVVTAGYQFSLMTSSAGGGMPPSMAAIFAGLMILVAGVPGGAIIYFLRSEAVRDAMWND